MPYSNTIPADPFPPPLAPPLPTFNPEWKLNFHVQVAQQVGDPHQAALTLVTTAYNHWITQDVRSDDITAIVIAFDWSTPVVDPPLRWGGRWSSATGGPVMGSNSSSSGLTTGGDIRRSMDRRSLDDYRPRWVACNNRSEHIMLVFKYQVPWG